MFWILTPMFIVGLWVCTPQKLTDLLVGPLSDHGSEPLGLGSLVLMLLNPRRERDCCTPESPSRGRLDRESNRIEQAVIVRLVLEERVDLLIGQSVAAHKGSSRLALQTRLLVGHISP